MEKIIRHLGLGMLAIAAIGIIILTTTGNNIVLIPGDQSLCGPLQEIHADGTCGIYEGERASNWVYVFTGAGLLGITTFLTGLFLGKKNGA